MERRSKVSAGRGGCGGEGGLQYKRVALRHALSALLVAVSGLMHAATGTAGPLNAVAGRTQHAGKAAHRGPRWAAALHELRMGIACGRVRAWRALSLAWVEVSGLWKMVSGVLSRLLSLNRPTRALSSGDPTGLSRDPRLSAKCRRGSATRWKPPFHLTDAPAGHDVVAMIRLEARICIAKLGGHRLTTCRGIAS